MALWQSARPPLGFTELWCQPLGSLAELRKLRARVRETVSANPSAVGPGSAHRSEQLVLIVDELASNALRHGAAPVTATLSRGPYQWLIAVTDSSERQPPTPAHGRDPGLGGFGLYLVADLSARHGWFISRGAKTAWAVVTILNGN